MSSGVSSAPQCAGAYEGETSPRQAPSLCNDPAEPKGADQASETSPSEPKVCSLFVSAVPKSLRKHSDWRLTDSRRVPVCLVRVSQPTIGRLVTGR